MLGRWGGLNVLMLDDRRAVLDASQPTPHRALKRRDFEPVPVRFRFYGPLGRVRLRNIGHRASRRAPRLFVISPL